MKEIPIPVIGSEVMTACGSEMDFAPDTPRTIFQSRWIFFCLPECREQFIQDPNSSCMAECSLNGEE